MSRRDAHGCGGPFYPSRALSRRIELERLSTSVQSRLTEPRSQSPNEILLLFGTLSGGPGVVRRLAFLLQKERRESFGDRAGGVRQCLVDVRRGVGCLQGLVGGGLRLARVGFPLYTNP